MAEILNENWVNIQEPVREMFIALSKVRNLNSINQRDIQIYIHIVL